MQRVVEKAGKIGINLNTLVLILVGTLIKHEAARIDEGLRRLDIVYNVQMAYTPKVDSLETRVSAVEGDVKAIKEHDTYQDREIERAIKVTR